MRLRATAAALAVATLPLGPGEPGQPAPATGPVRLLSPDVVEAIEVVLGATMARLGIPGISVAIGRRDALVFANGYGLADLENFVPAKADTVYRLASLSKPITAVALLQLVERDQVALDAPVREHCPAFPEKPWPLTPRQLLLHRGGIRHYRDGEQPMTRRFTSLDEGLSLFKDDPLEFEPGTRFLYSTYGYNLLGCVLEGATGRPYLEVIREAVFAPAEMTRSGPDDVRALVVNRARGYVRDGNGTLLNSALADMSYKAPGGGLAGTAPDMARFGLALLSGRLLGSERLEDMLRPEKPVEGQGELFGLGLSVANRDLGREAWHLGGQERVSAAFYLQPDEGLAVVVLANLEGVQPQLLGLARGLADLVAARPSAP